MNTKLYHIMQSIQNKLKKEKVKRNRKKNKSSPHPLQLSFLSTDGHEIEQPYSPRMCLSIARSFESALIRDSEEDRRGDGKGGKGKVCRCVSESEKGPGEDDP